MQKVANTRADGACNVGGTALKKLAIQHAGPRHTCDRRLRFESLEHRTMPAVFMVTNLGDAPVVAADDAPGTLRQALFDASESAGPDTVEFQNGLTGTITLTAGELTIDSELSLVGPSAELLTINAVGNDLVSPGINDGSGSRVLNVDDGDVNVVMSVEIRGLTLTGGDVSGDGGGIRSSESLTLTEVKIIDNSAVGTGVRGGGVFSYGGDLTIDHTTISGNSTTGTGANGGAIFSTTRLFGLQRTSISNSSLTGNTASGSGGGIFTGNNLLEDQTTRIVNSTISGNSAAGRGGGLFAYDGSTMVLYSTITDNSSATGAGGGIASFGDQSTSTEVRSSIISGNTVGGDLAIVSGIDNSFQSNGYNLVGSGNVFGPANQFSALDNFTAQGDQSGVLDPGLGVLTDNGGLTLTHALLPTSPALDAGDPNALVNVGDVPEFDQRGAPFGRIEDGNGDSIARIDIGVFESPLASADFDVDGDIDGADFLAWQRGFGTMSGAEKSDGDANNDGAVNGDDLDVWSDMFGENSLPVVAAQAATTNSELQNRSVEFDAVGKLDTALEALAVAGIRTEFGYMGAKALVFESLPVHWTHRWHNAVDRELAVARATLPPNQIERVTVGQDSEDAPSQRVYVRQDYLIKPELVDRLLSSFL